MNLNKAIRIFSRLCLFFTFLVIIAGSVVRMTGSGMGCPDWPKCFGHYVPPVDGEELAYTQGKFFSRGQMMILNDTLWVANTDLTAGSEFNRSEWHKYPKHDYAVFNVLHTWVEYINRLATVFYGIPVIILSLLALLVWIKQGDRLTFILALLTDLMIAYEIWLGKLVVDGNLKENSITYHMFGSVAILTLLLMLVYRHSSNKVVYTSSPAIRTILVVMLVMAFLQVMLGTQVREEVDLLAKTGLERAQWIDHLPIVFKVHRSFSILVVLLAIVLWMQVRKVGHAPRSVFGIVWVVMIEVGAGVILAYFEMPKAMQPFHLLMGVVLFAVTLFAWLKYNAPAVLRKA